MKQGVFICQKTIFKHFLLTGKKLVRFQVGSAAQFPSTKAIVPPSDCLGKRGPWVLMLNPCPASGSTVRTPARFPIFQGMTSSGLKVLSAEIHIFNGQYKHFTN